MLLVCILDVCSAVLVRLGVKSMYYCEYCRYGINIAYASLNGNAYTFLLSIPNRNAITGIPKMSTIMKASSRLKNCQLGRFIKLQGVNLNYNVCTTLITIVFVLN